MQFQKYDEYFFSCPGAWLLRRGFKEGNIDTQTVESLFKRLYPKAAKMAVEAEWHEATKIIITQEEKAAEI